MAVAVHNVAAIPVVQKKTTEKILQLLQQTFQLLLLFYVTYPKIGK